MNQDDLKEQYAILKVQLTEVNTQITAIIKTKNKRYTYGNIETTHSAETQSLKELKDLKLSIKQEMAVIEGQLVGYFVKVKNF
jgi:hypothetical protein